MKFEEVLPALRKGKKVRINVEIWVQLLGYITLDGNDVVVDKYGKLYELDLSDLNADDWEVVKEPKKVKLRDLTEWQYEKWYDANCCNKRASDCLKCIFHNVICKPDLLCWTKHKDLYSDKFLDQEVEIDE